MPIVLHKQFQAPPGSTRAESVIFNLKHLSESDASELKRYAAFMALRIHKAVFHAGAQDLLHEAIARTMDGRRNQPSGVDFVTHLKGCMRSIAWEYTEDAARERSYSQTAERDRLTASVSTDDLARETLQRIRTHLKADKVALRVFDRLREGYKAAEIQKLLGIDDRVYQAARKKIYRRVQGLYEA